MNRTPERFSFAELYDKHRLDANRLAEAMQQYEDGIRIASEEIKKHPEVIDPASQEYINELEKGVEEATAKKDYSLARTLIDQREWHLQGRDKYQGERPIVVDQGTAVAEREKWIDWKRVDWYACHNFLTEEFNRMSEELKSFLETHPEWSGDITPPSIYKKKDGKTGGKFSIGVDMWLKSEARKKRDFDREAPGMAAYIKKEEAEVAGEFTGSLVEGRNLKTRRLSRGYSGEEGPSILKYEFRIRDYEAFYRELT